MNTRPWSCDTFVALPDRTDFPGTMLAKNSDRPAGESQSLRSLPRRSGGTGVRLAYLTVADVDVSWAHVGASPYWCRGHEFGVNEWSVAIGNEALFTRDLAENQAAARTGTAVPYGILGMELVRLGLERARTAADAVEVMGALVSEYGQWGSGVPGVQPEEGAYDNSYLIADPAESWVLETSGTEWVCRRIDRGTYSISNQPTIRTEFDRSSSGLIKHAGSRSWWPEGREPFDFARAYCDPSTPLQASQVRLQRSRQLLAADGPVTLAAAQRILRDHYESSFLDGPYFNAAIPDLLTLCMHEHPAGFTWGNTAGSAVFVLTADPERLSHLWWTPVTPCTGVYIPIFPAAGVLPEMFSRIPRNYRRPEDVTGDVFDPSSYWWRFQQLLDVVKGGEQAWEFGDRQPIVRSAFDALEAQWTAKLPEIERRAVTEGSSASRLLGDFTAACAREALSTLEELLVGFGHDPAISGDPRWSG